MDHCELIDAFESGTLPPDSFHHRDHVQVAWIYLHDDPPAVALQRFSDNLRRFAVRHGQSGLYHETITWALLLLIHERMRRAGAATDWETFAEQNPDLLQWSPSILDSYYRPETLASDHARRVFVLPDLRIAIRHLTPTSRNQEEEALRV